MRLHDIAWSSLKRRRARFGFMLAALVLAVGTVVALVTLARAMRAEVGDELDRFGANIVVTPKSRALALAYGSLTVGGLTVDARELTLDDAARIRTIPNARNVSAVAPKLVGTTTLDGRPALLIGAVWNQEPGIKTWWQVDGRLADRNTDVMLGAEAARALAKRPGDVLVVGPHEMRVAGVLAPNGSVDDEAVFADLGVVQGLLGRPGAVSMIEVSALCRGCPIEDIVDQIAAVLPHARVAPIRQAVAARERAVLQFTRFAYAVSLVVVLVGTLVVLTTMMGAVTERTQEIGILRAVGFRRAHVAQVVLIEALAVNVAGGVLGWIAGTAAARAVGPALAQLPLPAPFDPWLALAAVLLAVGLGMAGGAYPAIRAAQLDPAGALRHL